MHLIWLKGLRVFIHDCIVVESRLLMIVSNEYIYDERTLPINEDLFSALQNRLKTTDFGCTLGGTSKRAQDTFYFRGIASYHAPKHLSEHLAFTNKSIYGR